MRRILFLLLVVFAVASPAAAQGAFRSDRIIVETRGRGPDVILIPGLGSTATAWGPAVNRLDDTHRLHLVTVRGKRKDGYAARYGRLQEFGTVHHAPQPFLRPAFDKHREKWIRAMGQVGAQVIQ